MKDRILVVVVPPASRDVNELSLVRCGLVQCNDDAHFNMRTHDLKVLRSGRVNCVVVQGFGNIRVGHDRVAFLCEEGEVPEGVVIAKVCRDIDVFDRSFHSREDRFLEDVTSV